MQPASPISIELVKAKFDEWRTTRQNKSYKIPEPLWDAVKQLYPYYSFAQISKTLGLSYLQLKSKLHIPVSKSKSENSSLFAEYSLPIIPSSPLEAKKDCVLEFSSPQGITVKINALSSDALIPLISLLLKNAP